MKKTVIFLLQLIIVFTMIAPYSAKALSNYKRCSYSININDKDYDLVYQVTNDSVILPFSEGDKLGNDSFRWIHEEDFEKKMLVAINSSKNAICPSLMAEMKGNNVTIYSKVKDIDYCEGVCAILQSKNSNKVEPTLMSASTSLLGKKEIRYADNCDTILGGVDDEDDVAWLINKILTYIKIAGPIIVIIFSSIDYLRALIQSDDETMAKLNKKLITRIVLVLLLFFLPNIVTALLRLFGLANSSSCSF